MITHNTQEYTDEGNGFRRLLRAAKEQVPVARLADDLGAELRGTRGRCPIHGGRNREAFSIRPDVGRWHCFRCNEGGDVLDLYVKARGYYDLKAALTDLAGEYNVQAPRRSERWHEWQNEKSRRHDALRNVRARLYQRRLFRMFREDLAAIADEQEREEEARRVFAELWPLADQFALWRAGR